MADIMTKLQFVQAIENMAVEYVKKGAVESIKRNSHLTKYPENKLTEMTVLDFVNFAGTYQGLDWALGMDEFQAKIKNTDKKIKKKVKNKPDNVIDMNL